MPPALRTLRSSSRNPAKSGLSIIFVYLCVRNIILCMYLYNRCGYGETGNCFEADCKVQAEISRCVHSYLGSTPKCTNLHVLVQFQGQD